MKSRRITAALLLAACGAGIRSTANNDEGIPELTLYNETTVAFAEALHDLYFDNIGFRIAGGDDFKKGDADVRRRNHALRSDMVQTHRDLPRYGQ